MEVQLLLRTLKLSAQVLVASAALLMSASMLTAATLLWHVSQAGAYTDTYMVVADWTVWAFLGLSVCIFIGAPVVRRQTRKVPGQPGHRAAGIAIALTAGAWAIVGLVWAFASA